MTIQKKRIIGLLDTPYVIAGEDAVLGIQLVDQFTRAPMNVSGSTGATAIFFSKDGLGLTKELDDGIEITDASQGLFAVALDDAETRLLTTGTAQSFQFSVTVGDATTIVQFVESFEVKGSLFL